MKKIKAIILAAGEGTRLRPYTLDRPKCLVEIEGRSLLERHLAVLTSERIDSVTLIGGYRVEMFDRKKYTVRENPSYSSSNMLWTLFCAESDMEGDILIAYGDIVYSPNILKKMMKSTADIAVGIDLEWESYWRARNEDPLDDAETLKMAADGRILEIGKKPQSIQEIEGQYMGIIRCSPRGVSQLKEMYHEAKRSGFIGGKPIRNAYMTDFIQLLIDAGHRVEAVPVKGEWVEIDTVEDLMNPITRERLNSFYN